MVVDVRRPATGCQENDVAIKGLVLVTALLLVPDAVLLVKAKDAWFSVGVAVASVASWVACVLILGSARRAVLVGLPFALLVAPEALFIANYGYPTTKNLIRVIEETSVQETSEFLTGSFGLLLAGTAASLLAWWVSFRRASATIWPAWRARLLGVALLVLAVGSMHVVRQVAWLPESVRLFTITNAFPMGVPFRLAGYLADRSRNSVTQERILTHAFGASSGEARSVVVMVIGESSRPDHWALGGYHRPTTPRLGARRDLYFFPNIVSPWNLTSYAVPVLIKRKNAQQQGILGERTILSAFREAGFKTYWISNQNGLTELDSLPTEAEVTRAYNLSVGRGDLDASFDEMMLAPVAEAVQGPDQKVFILIHVKGSHLRYDLRYPERFRVFKPDRLDAGMDPRSAESKAAVVNAYDNSILYTDFFLDQLIAALEHQDRPASLMFVSDHGEVLMDDACTMLGHGSDSAFNFRIAALAWISRAWRENNPAKAEFLSRSFNLPLTTEFTVFHTLADLGGLSIVNPSYSLLSGGFRGGRRLVNTSLSVEDIDAAELVGPCQLIESSKRALDTSQTAAAGPK